MLFPYYILTLYGIFFFFIFCVNTEIFTKRDNETVFFGSVSSVSLDNKCHFCTCLVRCSEDAHCIGVETNKMRPGCKFLLQNNFTRNSHALKRNIDSAVYVTSGFNEYGEILIMLKNMFHLLFILHVFTWMYTGQPREMFRNQLYYLQGIS